MCAVYKCAHSHNKYTEAFHHSKISPCLCYHFAPPLSKPLEKGKATHSSILAWRIPWTIVRGVRKSRTRLGDFHFTFTYPGLSNCCSDSAPIMVAMPSLPMAVEYCHLVPETAGSTILIVFKFPTSEVLILRACKECKVLVTQSCLTLCDPMNYSLLGSFVHGILQARILEWVAIRFSRGSSQPRDWTQFSCIATRFFTIWATRKTQGHIKHTIKTREGRKFEERKIKNKGEIVTNGIDINPNISIMI